MKKILILTVICWFILETVAFSQKQSLGLVYELAFIKAKSEEKLQLALLQKPAKPNPDIVVQYIAVKAAFDPIISQLVADVQTKNSLNYYKKLDELVKGSHNFGNLIPTNDTAIQRYSKALFSADSVYQVLHNTDVKALGILAVDDVISAATLMYSIIKDAQDARTTKVTKVAALLESLRLSPVDSVNKADGK